MVNKIQKMDEGLPLKPCCPFLINKIKVISENLDNNISLKNFMVDFIINFLCNASDSIITITNVDIFC